MDSLRREAKAKEIIYRNYEQKSDTTNDTTKNPTEKHGNRNEKNSYPLSKAYLPSGWDLPSSDEGERVRRGDGKVFSSSSSGVGGGGGGNSNNNGGGSSSGSGGNNRKVTGGGDKKTISGAPNLTIYDDEVFRLDRTLQSDRYVRITILYYFFLIKLMINFLLKLSSKFFFIYVSSYFLIFFISVDFFLF